MGAKWRSVEDTLEDLNDLDNFGVGATEAAQRADFPSAEALEKWLYNHDHYPLWKRLKARDPEGAHTPEKRRLRMTETTTDNIGALISKAQKSTRKRTRTKADRVSDLIAELRRTLDIEAHEDEARKVAQRDVERLKRELADAQARLKGGAPENVGPVAADIRAWAQDEGMDCPTKGRIPEAVRDAYLAATEQQQAS